MIGKLYLGIRGRIYRGDIIFLMLIHKNLAQEKNDAHTDPHAIEKYRFIHHFVPHEYYQTRAKLLSHKALVVYLIFILLAFGVFRIVPRFFPGVLGYASNIAITDLFELTNKVREKNGEALLRLNPQLSLAAEKKAKNMFENNYWAHRAPDGTEPWKFILDEGYDYAYAGENLAKNFNDSDAVVEAWTNSPSHKQNLLSQNYDEIGFGIANGTLDGYETTLVVQMFGRPQNPSLVASKETQDRILESYKTTTQPLVAAVPIQTQSAQVLPAIDVSIAGTLLILSFTTFLLTLLILDVWYSKKKGILKFTGHTFAHITILILAVLGVLFVLSPGVIL